MRAFFCGVCDAERDHVLTRGPQADAATAWVFMRLDELAATPRLLVAARVSAGSVCRYATCQACGTLWAHRQFWPRSYADLLMLQQVTRQSDTEHVSPAPRPRTGSSHYVAFFQ